MTDISDYLSNFGQDFSEILPTVTSQMLIPQAPLNAAIGGMVATNVAPAAVTAQLTAGGGAAALTQDASDVAQIPQNIADYLDQQTAQLQQTAVQWGLIAGGAVLVLLILNDTLIEKRTS